MKVDQGLAVRKDAESDRDNKPSRSVVIGLESRASDLGSALAPKNVKLDLYNLKAQRRRRRSQMEEPSELLLKWLPQSQGSLPGNL